VSFTIETYNSIYERTGGIPLELTLIKDGEESFNYSFTSDADYNNYPISSFPPGIYTYMAKSRFDGKPHTQKGEFLIKAIQLEKMNRVANHVLLRQIAENSGGRFFKYDDEEELTTSIAELNLQGRLISTQDYLPLINLVAILFIIIVLMSTEWFFRKYLGSY
jgi:hypothetical protein